MVALDVKSGEVLAMASCPDFDPNLFASGISSEDWESLQSENPRDPLSSAPMYNVATMSAVQPGSIFKMVTATAAMECGLDPGRKLYDDGYVQVGNKSFGCVVWNRSHRKHGYLNLQEALEGFRQLPTFLTPLQDMISIRAAAWGMRRKSGLIPLWTMPGSMGWDSRRESKSRKQ